MINKNYNIIFLQGLTIGSAIMATKRFRTSSLNCKTASYFVNSQDNNYYPLPNNYIVGIII